MQPRPNGYKYLLEQILSRWEHDEPILVPENFFRRMQVLDQLDVPLGFYTAIEPPLHRRATDLYKRLEAANRIHAYARAVSGTAPAAEREVLKQSAESFIAGISHWPKGGIEALASAWVTAETAEPPAALHEKALRLLCIRSEILRELPTPAEDQGLRSEYQMQRLVERMGRGVDPADDGVESLALEWTRSHSVSEGIYKSLFARFCDSLRSSPHTRASVSGR